VDTQITGQVGNVQTTIDGSNVTLDTNISGSNTTVDTDITAQSVGNIDTIINGQVGDVDIRFASQLGNVDINFEDQTGGVESATEFAASQQTTVSGGTVINCPANGFSAGTLFTNNTGNPVVVEFLSGGQTGGFADAVLVRLQLRDANSNTIAEVEANPVNLPLTLDPGIRIPPFGEVSGFVQDSSGTSIDYSLEFVGRELV
jgi:hypothetical protein